MSVLETKEPIIIQVGASVTNTEVKTISSNVDVTTEVVVVNKEPQVLTVVDRTSQEIKLSPISQPVSVQVSNFVPNMFPPSAGNVPAGGNTGDILEKASSTDYDTQWTTPRAAVLKDFFTAGSGISALKMVIATNSNTAIYGQNNSTYQNANVIGISITAATIGNQFEILFYGRVLDLSFNFPINDPLYLTTNGNITNVAPSVVGEYSVMIGKSLGPGGIFIDIKQPILI